MCLVICWCNVVVLVSCVLYRWITLRIQMKKQRRVLNPGDQGLPSEFVRSESHAPVEPNEALLKISQNMTRVLERLIAPKAPICMIRRRGAKEFHGSSMEEYDKVEFWLEKL